MFCFGQIISQCNEFLFELPFRADLPVHPGVLKSQSDIGGNSKKKFPVSGSYRPLPIDEFQNADDFTLAVVDRQGEKVSRTVPENLIEARFKAGIGVSIGDIQDLARRCHCSGCSGAHGQRDFKIFDFLSDQRVQGISSTIDYEHRYPVDRDFGTNNIQYNFCEFLQFERRVQQPRGIQQRFQPADLGTRIRRIVHRRVLYILRLNFRQAFTLDIECRRSLRAGTRAI